MDPQKYRHDALTIFLSADRTWANAYPKPGGMFTAAQEGELFISDNVFGERDVPATGRTWPDLAMDLARKARVIGVVRIVAYNADGSDWMVTV